MGMNREILFRGKRIDNGEWVEGSLLHDTEQNESYIAECFEDKAAYIRQVIPETVGQYTGLTDKNGRKIFEGDVLLVSDTDTAIVEYDETAAMFMAVFGYTDSDYTSLCNQYPDIEIIGNIHDNPELLGGGEKADY